MTVRRTLATALLTAAVAAPAASVAQAMPAMDPGHHGVRVEQTNPRGNDPATRRWVAYQQAVSARATPAAGAPSVGRQGGVSPLATWLIVAGGLFVALSIGQLVARATGHGLRRRHA